MICNEFMFREKSFRDIYVYVVLGKCIQVVIFYMVGIDQIFIIISGMILWVY